MEKNLIDYRSAQNNLSSTQFLQFTPRVFYGWILSILSSASRKVSEDMYARYIVSYSRKGIEWIFKLRFFQDMKM